MLPHILIRCSMITAPRTGVSELIVTLESGVHSLLTSLQAIGMGSW